MDLTSTLSAIHGLLQGLAVYGLTDVSRVATGSVVAAVWQGVLLAAGAALCVKLLPKAPAAARFAIWFAVFVVMAGLPTMAVWGHGGGAGSGHAWLTLNEDWCLAIAALWAGVSLVRAAGLVVSGFRLRALWRRATPVAMDEALCGADGKARRAQLCTSDEVDRPSVIGFFAPKILIPGWLYKKLTREELEQIVLHEAGHLGRADDWMNLLQKIALVVFPLNPALAWVERRLCFERELACDERVLRATNAPKAYAACLATLAEYRLGRRASSPGLALGFWGTLRRESELGRRVGRILRRGERMSARSARLAMGGAMLALLVSAAGLERCPRMVVFSGAGADAGVVHGGVAAMAPGGPVNLMRGYRAQAVVFRPDTMRVRRRDAWGVAEGVRPVSERRVSARAVVRRAVSQGAAAETNRAAVAGARVDAGVAQVAASETVPHETLLRAVVPVAGQAAGAKATLATAEGAEPVASAGARPVGVRAAGAASGPGDAVLRPAAASAGMTQWVVVTTAWQGADGSRVVLTTIESTGGGAPGTMAQQLAGFHRYAAVPMRGGWLFFQL